jgi:hypothetical protein
MQPKTKRFLFLIVLLIALPLLYKGRDKIARTFTKTPVRKQGKFTPQTRPLNMATTLHSQNFEGISPPAVPSGWTFGTGMATAGSNPINSNNGVEYATRDGSAAGCFYGTLDGNGGDAQITATMRSTAVANTTQALLTIRGTIDNIPFSSATHYEARLSFGAASGEVQMFRRVAGSATQLGTHLGAGTLLVADTNYRATLRADGPCITLWIQRLSDSLWLSAAGNWQTSQVPCRTEIDNTIAAQGYAGFGAVLGAASTATLYYDDILIETLDVTPVNLTTLTRSVDLSALSGNPSATDPLFVPMGSAALSTLTYSSGVATIANGASSAIWLLTAVPLAAYCTPSARLDADEVVVDWEQRTDNSATYTGGVMFYHYSGGLYGPTEDSDGYLCQLTNNAGTYQYSVFRSDETVFTAEAAATNVPFSPGTWTRFRATLTGTPTSKHVKYEYHDGSAWQTLRDIDVTNVGPNIFGVAFRVPSGTFSLSVRSISVQYKGFPLVVVPVGQSELSGHANTAQTNTDTDCISINRRSGHFDVINDPWQQSVAANASLTGVTAEAQSSSNDPYGSPMPDLLERMGTAYGAVATHGYWVLGGAGLATLEPGAGRFTTSTFAGAAELMTTLLAGDGRTTGQTVKFGVYHTTGNYNGSGWTGTGVASKANYKTKMQAILTRIHALWPTATVYVAAIGDRTWRYAGTDAMNAELRAAHQEMVTDNPTYAAEWFDESDRTGAVGDGTGWPDLDADSVHPGAADNTWLSLQMATGMGASAGSGNASSRMLMGIGG